MMDWQYSNYSKINSDIQKHFPFENPRADQLETISEIIEAINQGYEYIVLEAGTGTGKSAIAATLSNMSESSYILTITKQLQDQYLRDFKDFRVVKGRANFNCQNYLNQSCSEGKCITEGIDCKFSLKNRENEIRRDNTCPYYYQKYLALNSKTVISNYYYMFLELNYVKDFEKRELLIFDEAHNLESTLMDELTLEFSKGDLKEYLNYNLTYEKIDELNNSKYTNWIDFINEIKQGYIEELEKLESLNKIELIEKIAFVRHQIGDCNRFIDNLTLDPETWIFDWDEDNQIAQFKPLKINNYTRTTLFDYADVCIFMSATILDWKLFSKWLGIPEDKIYAIRRKSPFDIKNNPITAFEDYNLSRSFIKANAPRSNKTIDEILNKHKNEKGIIHTVSLKCRDLIMDKLDNPRLITHDKENKTEVIEKFIKSDEPLVLISPSMGEGVDLPGDLCRFQIIYKLPFPDWGDKQINQRTGIDREWYDYKTCLNIVQTHGRGMRYLDDYCHTYVIDNRFKSYIKESYPRNFLPDRFRESIEGMEIDLEEKNRLMKIGDEYLNNNDYENGIRFFKQLLDDDLFLNDIYPYMSLSRLYHETELYESEVQIIMKYLSSGNKSEHFNKQLAKLSDMGYY